MRRVVPSGAVATALVAAAIAVAGCGPDGPDAPTAAGEAARNVPASADIVLVRAIDNTFRPETIEVPAGTEVRWVNGGQNDHNVLPVDERQEWGVDTADFLPGDEYSAVFDTPGVYRYYCSIHGTKEVGMIGTVVVE